MRVAFLLVPQFSMMSFASAIEPLRAAHRLSGRSMFQWEPLSSDGAAVAASNGIVVAVDQGLDRLDRADVLLICMGLEPQSLAADRIQDLQQQCPNRSLGRDGRSARLGVELLGPTIHLRHRLADHRADRRQRMLRRNPRFRGNVAEHRFLLPVRSTHRSTSIVRQITSTPTETLGFPLACKN